MQSRNEEIISIDWSVVNVGNDTTQVNENFTLQDLNKLRQSCNMFKTGSNQIESENLQSLNYTNSAKQLMNTFKSQNTKVCQCYESLQK